MAFLGTDPTPLGALVKHKLTGEEGIVEAKYYVVSGCCEITVRSKEPKPEGGFRDFYCSTTMIDIIDPKAFPCEIFEEKSGYDFCQDVDIPHLGVRGTIVSFGFYINNADHVEVQPPYNHAESKKPSPISVPEKLIVPTEGAKPEPNLGAQRPSPTCVGVSQEVRRT